MFIKLTRVSWDKKPLSPVYVNADRIKYFEANPAGGTIITMQDGGKITVKETTEEIVAE